MQRALSQLDSLGFSVVEEGLTSREVATLLADVSTLLQPEEADTRGGQRDLFSALPSVRKLAGHPAIHRWPAAVLGPAAFAVRAILFDKTPVANWKVTWHQDLTIPTLRQRDVAGFGPWSEKAGIPHVQPPAAILSRMLTVRVHLDACETWNGPVRVLPGSHLEGRLSPEAVDGWKARTPATPALCPAGGLLLMRPLLLHASSPAERPGHRRVIHLEYAVDPLPDGLEWRERWGRTSPAT